MPYITIAEAARATGKSQKTIRRLATDPKSKNYVSRDGEGVNAPVLIDTSYLASVYPMSTAPNVGQPSQPGTIQDQDNGKTVQGVDVQGEMLSMLKEQLRLKDEQLAAKDRRIEDLTDKLTHIRLLTEGPPKEEPAADPKKKSWWRW